MREMRLRLRMDIDLPIESLIKRKVLRFDVGLYRSGYEVVVVL